MKRIYIKNHILDYILKNKWQFLLVFLSFFIGIITGTYFSISMNTESLDAMNKYINNFVSAYNLQSVNSAEVFKFSVYNNLKTVLLLWLCGLWKGFLPITLLQIAAKGYKLGFSLTLFSKSFGLKGLLFTAVSTIPQIFIMIPALIFYSVFNINFAVLRRNSKIGSLSAVLKNEFYIKSLIYLAVIIILSIFVSFLDAYIIPQILKPICSVWGKK